MKKIAIIHLGAREYYAIPRMLLGQGHNVRVYTDLYRRGIGQLLMPFSKQIARRFHEDLPARYVVHWPTFAWRYATARRRAGNVGELESVFHHFGKEFAQLCLPELEKFCPDVIVSFSTTALEIFQKFKGRSHLILDQIDGGIEEDAMVERERQKYPDWEKPGGILPPECARRILDEWILADRIVVNSPFSAKCLITSGVCPDKIQVIPLSYESRGTTQARKEGLSDSPLKVVFAGTLCLRKGIHLLDAALSMMKQNGEAVEFHMAGPNQLEPTQFERIKQSHQYHGILSAEDTKKLLGSCHILILPSIAEGFGMVQLEALSAGCRVITTKNAGEVVNHSSLGRVIEPHCPEQIIQAISEIAQEIKQDNHGDFQNAASDRLKDFSLESVARMWDSALEM